MNLHNWWFKSYNSIDFWKKKFVKPNNWLPYKYNQ